MKYLVPLKNILHSNIPVSLVIVLYIVLYVSPSYAIDPEYSRLLGVKLVVPFSTGDFGDTYGIGYGLGVTYVRGFTSNAALNLDLNYTVYKNDEKVLNEPVNSNQDILNFAIAISYIMQGLEISPYFNAGVGAYYWNEKDDIRKNSSTDVGLNLGSGLIFNLTNNWCLDLELKYDLVFSNWGYDDSKINYFSLNTGLVYYYQ